MPRQAHLEKLKLAPELHDPRIPRSSGLAELLGSFLATRLEPARACLEPWVWARQIPMVCSPWSFICWDNGAQQLDRRDLVYDEWGNANKEKERLGSSRGSNGLFRVTPFFFYVLMLIISFYFISFFLFLFIYIFLFKVPKFQGSDLREQVFVPDV